MNQNIVYLGNVLSQCSEKDIYQLFIKFGKIKRIKLFCETFQGVNYPVGFALIEFIDRVGYEECLKNKQHIQFQNSLIHVHETKPDTKFGVSVFVFFNDDKVNRESLLEFFENVRPVDVRIKNAIGATSLGFAIIEFPTTDAKEIALGLAPQAPFTIIAPSQKCIELSYSGIPEQTIAFSPDRTPFINNPMYERFYDLEIIHNGTTYKVNSFLASAFSSRIHHLVLSNACLNRVEMRINEPGDFLLIVNVLFGQQIEITEENAYFLFLMAADLGIEFLMNATSGFILSKMTPEGALHLTYQLGDILLSDGPHIRYMAANNEAMRSLNEFQDLPIPILGAIFHNQLFNPGSIDVYCDWLISFVTKKPEERMRLLQFIKFDEKSKRHVLRLFKNNLVNVNIIRTPLLEMMKNGLTAPPEGQKEVIECRHRPDRPDYGVFAMFCERCSGNPQDFNMVKVTSNTTLPKIIEPGWTEWWSTPNESGSWIEFDLKSYKLIPSCYTLKTMFADVKLPYMRSWRIEGSNDEVHWDLLSEQRNSNTTTEQKQWHTWDVITDKEYRYIKLTQIDRNGSGNYCLFIHGIEFFGRLIGETVNTDLRHENGKDWKGVFDFLTQKCRGNPAEKGEIEIKSSCDPKYLIDKTWQGCWRSPKVPNSWVMIEFINTEIILSSYSLRTHYGPAHIRSWDVEVSKDKETWYTVDSRVNRDEYKQPYTSLHWICTAPQPDPMKYVRFTMTGPSSRNENIFWLSNIELFGDLFRPR